MAEQRDAPGPRQLDELQDLMERVGESDERVEQVLKVASVDPETYSELRELYRRRASQVVTKDVFYPYEGLDGSFPLGADPEGRRIGLTREQLNEHLLVVAMTGRGKTTFFYNLMETCAAEDVPYMVFDFKNDYRHLVADQDLLVINWRDLKFNPLKPPPGVSPGKWGEILADTFAHATDLLIGSESYVLEKLRVLYDCYGEAETERSPSFFEFRDLVRSDSISKASPKFKYKERVESRLSMMTGFSGDIFDCSSGYPLDELLDRNVAFELKEPNQYVTNFFVEAVLTWIFYYRDAQGQRQQLRHLVMFDEAKRVFDANRSRQPASGYPPIDDLVGKVREFGEAIVVADHEPSKLSDSLKANTNAKIWMTLGSGTDIQEMARTFGLDPDEVDFTRTMEKGEAIIKLADTDPVPILLPDYELEKSLTEDEIRAQMTAKLDALPSAERVRPQRFQEVIGTGDEEAEDGVGDVGEALLASVNDQPFLGLAERYDALGVGSKTGTAAKNELLTLDLVREVEIATGTPGRNPKLLELTQTGRGVLDDRGYQVTATGKGSIEHRWWQQQVKEFYEEQGFEATIEYAVGDQHIDVYAEREAETVAVEVARSPDHEVANIKKCLQQDIPTVRIASTAEDVTDQIQSALRDELGQIPGAVEFVPVSTFA